MELGIENMGLKGYEDEWMWHYSPSVDAVTVWGQNTYSTALEAFDMGSKAVISHLEFLEFEELEDEEVHVMNKIHEEALAIHEKWLDSGWIYTITVNDFEYYRMMVWNVNKSQRRAFTQTKERAIAYAENHNWNWKVIGTEI